MLAEDWDPELVAKFGSLEVCTPVLLSDLTQTGTASCPQATAI